MKKKIGTVLDENLFYKAKEAALLQKITLSQLFEDALKVYLLMAGKSGMEKQTNIVKSTQGVMKISPSDLKAVMEEEGVYDA